jgi:hypothetical protein
MINIKFLFKIPFYLVVLFFDIIKYKFFKKKNTKTTNSFLINLFCITQGYSNTFINNLLKKNKLQKLDSNINKNETLSLKKNGWYLTEKFLEKKFINEIKNKIKNLSGKYYSDGYKSKTYECLNINKILGSKFSYNPNDLIKIPEIQDLLTNSYILDTAEKYLDSCPIIDLVECWWTFPSDKPDSAAAQLFHFDLDRPKWLKVFIFLTDCDTDSGPHKFITATHLNNGIHKEILRFNYNRIEDELINKIYNPNLIKEFITKEGSILFEDTRGLHKGTMAKKKSRLLLQFQYSSAIFGSESYKIKFPENKTKNFEYIIKKYPQIFENFIN